MSASVSPSPHGFVAVRGRGYRPEQVERYAAGLSQDRDAAWERAACLTVLTKEMEAEAARMREQADGLAPQTYEALGRRAQHLLAVVEEEAAELTAAAHDRAQEIHDAVAVEVAAVRDAAREYADTVLADAEARAQEILVGAQRAAEEARADARRDVKEWRSEAVAALREMRQHTAGLLADQEKEHARALGEGRARAHRTRGGAGLREAERTAHAESGLADAKRVFAEAQEAARHGQEDAEARAAELLVEARVREERVVRETERILREHDDAREEVQAHMAHVRTSLAALTGRAAAEG